MGTRAHIAYQKSDGTIKFIYHRWDSYIKHLGNLLNEHLKDENLVEKLFEVGSSISSTSTIKEHIRRKTDKNISHKKDYIKSLTTTKNYQVGELFITTYKDNREPPNYCKDREELLTKCKEEYIYLYENKKWNVKPYLSKNFVDLSFAVEVNDMLEDVLRIIREEKEVIGDTNKIFELNEQKMSKSYDFVNIKRTPEQDVFMKEVLTNKRGTEFVDLINSLAHTKKIMMFNEKIGNNLSEKQTEKVRLKI